MQYKAVQKLPDSPGVYFFLNAKKKILYIGKATSLKDRVKSYFSNDLISTRGQLLVKMVEEAKSVDFKKTDSVLEALLLEADLIKKFKPLFNTKEKDDKSFNCVVVTEEDFPQILIIRKKDIDFDLLQTVDHKLRAVYGPYTNGLQLKEALKIIQKIFPYRDSKCMPKKSKVKSLESKDNAKSLKLETKLPRACFNYSIGLCPGVCIGAISKEEYAKTIRHLKTFFEGNVKKLVNDLEKEMKDFAKKKEFEKAGEIKNKIYALTHIHDISLIKQSDSSTHHSQVPAFRIESYDIAHMSGDNMVGVMVVLQDGQPEKNSYRKFKIKGFDRSNDVGALREIIERRLGHPEWQKPDLVVIDGGIAQLNVANAIFDERNISIPAVSVLKDERHQPKDVLGDQMLAMRYRKDILFSNAEAHRFAIGYHKKLRRKNFLK